MPRTHQRNQGSDPVQVQVTSTAAPTGQKPVVVQLDESALASAPAPSDRLVFSSYFSPTTIAPLPADADTHAVETLRAALSSELGFLFLDRTRITPKGFALGEHIASLSLAPGEEVVLEQKTFSKRETSFEEVSEQERQYDMELSSTLTTELTEGLERENSRTGEDSFRGSLAYGSNIGGQIPGTPVTIGADVKAEAGYSRTVTDADRQTQSRSLKDSTTATSKVASKYRATHRTTFQISTEDRFESSSKRVIRNPNRYTPVDLQYFKVLRRLELTEERYGVRLCWAPAVNDPAADVMRRIELERQAILERALAGVELPPRPAEPPKPDKQPRIEQSAVKEADQWQLNGGMSADYDLPITIPGGYVWNEDVDEVSRLSSAWGRPRDNMGWHIVGTPWVADGKLIVRMHIGARGWIGGPKVFMQAKARFIAAPAGSDPAYQAAYEKWLADVQRWEAEVAAKLEPIRARARAQADEWQRAMMASLNPVAEVMGQIVKEHLLGPLSDERWEIDFWTQVFDWDRAGVKLSPGYWTTRPARDQLNESNSFLNASSAKFYLPVRPGFERLALRWIVARVRDGELDPTTEAAFLRIVKELKDYRETFLGGPNETKLIDGRVEEKFVVLGRWAELLPTDGTHLEVVQGMTTALDADSSIDRKSDRSLQDARTIGEEQDAELKKKAVALIGSPSSKINYSVEIATEERSAATDGVVVQ